MKKIFLSIAFLSIALISHSQKANIQSVINYLKDNDITEAKKLIDQTVINESTANNAKAWILKAVIDQAIATPKDLMPELVFMLNEKIYKLDLTTANSLQATHPDAYKTSLDAYQKSLSLDSKYNKEEILPLLQTMLAIGFNKGINEMNDSKFDAAYKSFNGVVDLSNLDAGKVWKGVDPRIDTTFAQAKLYQGNCAFQLNDLDKAITLFEESAKNPFINNADLFIMMTDIYETKGNEAKWLETIKVAKSKFPNDKRIINNEINYYSKSGKSEELIAKLKEGIALEPKKTDLYLILGQTYYNLANPTDAKTGKELAKPANSKELEQNAVAQYSKALEIEPNNYFAQFYSGLVYYNQAKVSTDEMNKADDKKYATLKPLRDALLEKTIPFLDKARTLIESEKINDSNKETYRQVLSGLMQTYNILGKSDKATAIQGLLNAVK